MVLLTVIVLLAGAALVVAALTTAGFLEVEDERVVATRAQLDRIVAALRGDPNLGTSGFVGDMGVLPATLAELVTAQVPTFTSAGKTLGVGMGWRGPYLPEEAFTGFELRDGWGRDLVYTTTLNAGGWVESAAVRSLGSDGLQGTADDIVSDTIYARGTLRLFVRRVNPQNPGSTETYSIPGNAQATLFLSARGTEQSLTVSRTNPGGGQPDYFLFPAAHAGPHAVRYFQPGGTLKGAAVLRVHANVETQAEITAPQ